MAPASWAGSSTRLPSAPPLLRNRGAAPADLVLGRDTAHRRIDFGKIVLLFHLHYTKTHYQ